MKPQIYAIRLMVIIGGLLCCSCPAHAVDFDFQPRLETGVINYSFEQGAASRNTLTGITDTSGRNETQEEIEYNTTMGFVGAGATLFVSRFFVDISGQYTAEGSDQLYVTSSTYSEVNEDLMGLSSYTNVSTRYDTEIDRADHAFSVGYAVTKRFSVFAGYKWAEVDIDTTFDGPFSALAVDLRQTNTGRMMGTGVAEFKYDGPFVGVTHGWEVDSGSIFQGLISINAGLARLDSKYVRRRIFILQVEKMNGQDVDVAPTDPHTLTEFIKGDTLGVTLGLSWRGITPVENLSYSLGISGHRYQFDSKDSLTMDISETSVSFKVGVAYIF